MCDVCLQTNGFYAYAQVHLHIESVVFCNYIFHFIIQLFHNLNLTKSLALTKSNGIFTPLKQLFTIILETQQNAFQYTVK